MIRDAQGGQTRLWPYSGTSANASALRRHCASKERYELAVRGAGVGIWDWDIRTGTLYYSPRWKMLLGYGENEIGEKLRITPA